MATNNTKRGVIKWVRDGIKSKYKKGSECEICGTHEELEFHHYHTVALLVENYIKANGSDVSTKDAIMATREEIYNVHYHELVEDGATLCVKHHRLLHKLYGKEPPLRTADKQRNWVKIQNAKFNGESTARSPSSPVGLRQFMTTNAPLTMFLTR